MSCKARKTIQTTKSVCYYFMYRCLKIVQSSLADLNS